MALIASISGIRGTIGGREREGLNPISVVRFVVAYAFWLRGRCGMTQVKVVIGRDARISGDMVSMAVSAALQGCGIEVLDIGLVSTPTLEMAVVELEAQGGIVITASHNDREWNALKLLNERGEFVSHADGQAILSMVDSEDYIFPTVDELGQFSHVRGMLERHVAKVVALPYVDVAAIRAANLCVAYDPVNSVGSLAVPYLLRALGVEQYIGVHVGVSGDFAHDPEPLPEHLGSLRTLVVERKADVGFAVDPDVDRLAIISENGEPFGEEYTLVAVADHVLSYRPGNTVSNLSSTSALRDITAVRGGAYYPSAVGEVNVVARMREVNAVIGGEGNGGVILPELHYGRDALVGIALFLTHLVKSGLRCSELRNQYPSYYISKNRLTLPPATNPDFVLEKVKQVFASERMNTEDGVRIEFRGGWVHLRRSNTEPIIRVYAECSTQEQADELAKSVVDKVNDLL